MLNMVFSLWRLKKRRMNFKRVRYVKKLKNKKLDVIKTRKLAVI